MFSQQFDLHFLSIVNNTIYEDIHLNVNLIEGYGNDNPGAKSQGMKQLMAGLALILLGIFLIPELIKMMSAATGATTKK